MRRHSVGVVQRCEHHCLEHLARQGTATAWPVYWWQVTAIDSNGNTTQADSGTWWVIKGQSRVFIPIVYRP
jgi:hypothetical protein